MVMCYRGSLCFVHKHIIYYHDTPVNNTIGLYAYRICVWWQLKSENCHDATFDVSGGIVGCCYDNLRCRQWRQICIMANLDFDDDEN